MFVTDSCRGRLGKGPLLVGLLFFLHRVLVGWFLSLVFGCPRPLPQSPEVLMRRHWKRFVSHLSTFHTTPTPSCNFHDDKSFRGLDFSLCSSVFFFLFSSCFDFSESECRVQQYH